MRRYSFPPRRLILAIASALVALMSVAASAQAVVVNDGGIEAGVALVPSARSITPAAPTLPTGVSTVTASGSCTDPWLATDLGGPMLPTDALCYRGGAVMHKNETFALTWDAPFGGTQRNYWEQTRGYVEQFLRDVADGSGSLSSPYAVTTQYGDGAGRVQNASIFGGGCIDYGVTAGSACEYGSPSGPGHDFPANGCTPMGTSFVWADTVAANDVCLTDAQIQSEVSTMVTQTGILGRTQPGYTPLVTLLLPPRVETCLDSAHTFCSANASLTPPPSNVTTTPSVTGATIPADTYQVEVTYVTSGGESMPSSLQSISTTGPNSSITISSPPSVPGVTLTGWYVYAGKEGGALTRQGGLNAIGSDATLTSLGTGAAPPVNSAFCSYHSEVNVGGTEVVYLVQPWTATTGCDEPAVPNIPPDPTPQQLSTAVGQRLVSPLSQAHIAAIVDPFLNGWVGLDGSETENNHACVPLPRNLDSVTVGSSPQNPYFLQREFNNAGALEFDPNTYFGCAPNVILAPSFVAPSAVDQGDVVQLDGSTTASTLIVSNTGYAWNFGDGTTATGPSVVHTYAAGGTYNVTLTVTDRGGNTATLTQTIQVLGSNGQQVTPAPAPAGTTAAGSASSGGAAPVPVFNVRLELMPQSLKSVLRSGIAVRVTSNRAANGIATVSITRASAKKAHIKVGSGRSVRIGLGTVSSISNGTVTLHLHLSPDIAKKLAHLRHVTMTIRLALVAPGNQQFAIDAAGRY